MRSLLSPSLEQVISSSIRWMARLEHAPPHIVAIDETDVATKPNICVLAHHHRICTIFKRRLAKGLLHEVMSLQPDIAIDLRKGVIII